MKNKKKYRVAKRKKKYKVTNIIIFCEIIIAVILILVAAFSYVKVYLIEKEIANKEVTYEKLEKEIDDKKIELEKNKQKLKNMDKGKA